MPNPSNTPRPADRTLNLTLRLLVATETRELPADVAAWLRDGLQAFLTDDGATLCRALGLRGAGRLGRVQSVLRQRQRNIELHAAVDLLDGNAAALSREVRRFRSRVWPRVRLLSAPPTHFTPLDSALFHVFRAGSPPESQNGIRNALRR